MEENGNKTIICSVLFLDIVEYSKKSVTGQISLKDRFNSYLADAIRDVPMTDRIILDTGDGAAINFIGDVEDALKAAISLRESLLNEEPDAEHPLLVRMGINLGPVRLVRDINGQPNIVGDGINVAQRVMGFADAAQILVSRSYYDAVSRLSPQYTGMFHYQGSRTDKHVREHEVYAIGYPGDKTTLRGANNPAVNDHATSTLTGIILHTVSTFVFRFKQAGMGQRALYAAVVVVPLLLLVMFMANLTRRGEISAVPAVDVITTHPVLAAAPVSSEVKPEGAVSELATATPKQLLNQNAEIKITKNKPKDNLKNKSQNTVEATAKSTSSENQTRIIDRGDSVNSTVVATPSSSTEAYISVTCVKGAEVFIDGIRKGRAGSRPLSVLVLPGKHAVIVSHTSTGVFTQSVDLSSGKTVHIRPSLCN